MKKHWITVVVAVIVAVVFFFVGKAIGQNGSNATQAGGRNVTSSTRGFGGRGMGGGFAAGQVVSVDGNSLTVQLPNGNSEVVFYSSSTQVIKPQPAPLSALTPGTMVLVGGSANPDGSVTAQTIQIRTGTSTFGGPAGRGGGQ